MKGPGADLFEAFTEAFGEQLPIIAEDLGSITEDVTALRDRFGLPGMKILQCAFDGDYDSSFLPHQFKTTNYISIAAIFLIIAIVFQSLSVPVVLVAAIVKDK